MIIIAIKKLAPFEGERMYLKKLVPASFEIVMSQMNHREASVEYAHRNRKVGKKNQACYVSCLYASNIACTYEPCVWLRY